jgi:Ca-activated chloride channel family protein
VLVLLISVSCVAAGASAARAVQRPVFPAATDMVHVTVSVRDEQGSYVTHLNAADFTLYENGKPQLLELFAQAVEPGPNDALALNLGLLLDTSESMLKQLKLSQETAIRFLDNIPRARDLITIFFDQDIRLSRYDSENQQGLIQRILEAKGGGNTALYDAIAVYLSRVQDSEGRKVLVVLTDGEDSTSSLGQGELNDVVRSSGVTIYPIAFQGGFPAGSTRAVRSKAFLMGLAELSGGQVFSPGASRDLAEVYKQILDELSSQYVLGFTSSDKRRDGKFRKLKVEVEGKDLKVRHRPGYQAPRR